jgi:hypothetical protein
MMMMDRMRQCQGHSLTVGKTIIYTYSRDAHVCRVFRSSWLIVVKSTIMGVNNLEGMTFLRVTQVCCSPRRASVFSSASLVSFRVSQFVTFTGFPPNIYSIIFSNWWRLIKVSIWHQSSEKSLWTYRVKCSVVFIIVLFIKYTRFISHTLFVGKTLRNKKIWDSSEPRTTVNKKFRIKKWFSHTIKQRSWRA